MPLKDVVLAAGARYLLRDAATGMMASLPVRVRQRGGGVPGSSVQEKRHGSMPPNRGTARQLAAMSMRWQSTTERHDQCNRCGPNRVGSDFFLNRR